MPTNSGKKCLERKANVYCIIGRLYVVITIIIMILRINRSQSEEGYVYVQSNVSTERPLLPHHEHALPHLIKQNLWQSLDTLLPLPPKLITVADDTLKQGPQLNMSTRTDFPIVRGIFLDIFIRVNLMQEAFSFEIRPFRSLDP